MENTTPASTCCCPCHKMNGILVTLLGLAFLLGNLEVISAKVLGISWPVLVILLGLKNICSDMCKCCKSEPKACC
ncbi:MAG: hypothetical protein A2X86_02805 [Bdellovibrionales bacterium GWA2_49_15]|nr:MAG: hypothetical protein A2X86_02805 [Bdellovibrionales bacterium GWA2_49_15]HAZ14131.1 hypothetical protein [Bdellovibrionales bacterium]